VKIGSFLAPWVYPEEVLLSEQFNYGHREVLLASNSMPQELIFLASLQHGWTHTRVGTPLLKKRNLQNYPVMVWSSRIANGFPKANRNNVVVTGSPWVHLLRALGITPPFLPQPANSGGKLVFFPSHSLPGASATHNYNIDNFIKTYGKHNVTVCLFWMDFIDPEIRAYYAKFSCQVVCLGYRGSSGFETPWAPTGGRTMFLPRLLDVLQSHDIVAVTDVSTPFWYALSLGKKLFITSKEENHRVWSRSTYIDFKGSYSSFAKSEHDLPIFPVGKVIEPTQELVQVALEELGWQESEGVMKSNEIGQLLKISELDKELINPLTRFIEFRKKSKQS
jgi:hypothetical protein